MSTIVIYQERLNEDELSFLHQKEEKERGQFYKIAKVFLWLSFICPFIIACLKVVGGAADPFSVVDYFIGVFFLMLFLKKASSEIIHAAETAGKSPQRASGLKRDEPS